MLLLYSLLFRARARLSREEGQTTAEYALVILAAAAVAVVLIAWVPLVLVMALALVQVGLLVRDRLLRELEDATG